MFKGIVQGSISAEKIEKNKKGARITFSFTPTLLQGLKQGASVAIDGVCLTVSGIEGNSVSFDVMKETLKKTTLGLLGGGQRVNIERSLTASDEIGGHLVSGHVMGMAEVVEIERENDTIITLSPPPDMMRYLFPKGFVALDGVSLTLVRIDRKENVFSVHLIPETLRITTFGSKEEGDFVNVEVDPQTVATVETVERILGKR